MRTTSGLAWHALQKANAIIIRSIFGVLEPAYRDMLWTRSEIMTSLGRVVDYLNSNDSSS